MASSLTARSQATPSLATPTIALIDQLFGLNVDNLQTGDELQAAYNFAEKIHDICVWLLHDGLAFMHNGCQWVKVRSGTAASVCDKMPELKDDVEQLQQISSARMAAIHVRVAQINDSRFTCSICMEPMPVGRAHAVHAGFGSESFKVLNGKCIACQSCLRDHINYNLHTPIITCPMSNCGRAIHESDIQRLLMTAELRQRRTAILNENYAAKSVDELARVLPLEQKCECGVLVQCSEQHDDMVTTVQAACQRCSKILDFNPKRTAMVQPCPNCQVAVFKDQGCINVTCICGCYFEWGSHKVSGVRSFGSPSAASLDAIAPEIKIQRSAGAAWPETQGIMFECAPTENQVAYIAAAARLLLDGMWCTDAMVTAVQVAASSFTHRFVIPIDVGEQQLIVIDFSDLALRDLTLGTLRDILSSPNAELFGKPADANAEEWIRTMFEKPFVMDDALRAASSSQHSTIVVVGGWQNVKHCRSFIAYMEHYSRKNWKLVDLQRIVHDDLRFLKSTGLLG